MRSPWLLQWTSCARSVTPGKGCEVWPESSKFRLWEREICWGGLVLKKEEDWIDGCCVIIVKLPLQQSVKITLLRAFANTHSHSSYQHDSYRHTDTLKRTTSPSHAKPKWVGNDEKFFALLNRSRLKKRSSSFLLPFQPSPFRSEKHRIRWGLTLESLFLEEVPPLAFLIK